MRILKLENKNITTIFFMIVVLAMENFCCLIPSDKYIINGIIKFSDIGVILAVLWMTWVAINLKGKRYNKKKELIYYIFFYLVLVLTSSTAAKNMVNQSIFLGIRSLRKQIISFLLYFQIINALECGLIKKNDLIKIMYIIGIFEIIVYFLQYILVDKVTFTFIETDEKRNDTARLRFPFLLPLIISFMSYNNLLEKKNNKIFNLFVFIFGLLVLIIICQHRAPSIICVISLAIGFVLWKKGFEKKYFIGILILLISINLISNSKLFLSAFDTIAGKNNEIATLDTMSIRKEGQEYYLEKIKQSPLFGYGNPNTNSAIAMEESGANENYFLVDNGIIGFFYIYGIVGIIWLILFFIKIFRCSIYVYKEKQNIFYITYCIFEIGNLYIGMHWYYYYTLPFILVITLLDSDVEKIKEKEKNNE